jgi:predicted O-linked N-acetylglucosamine transferase (SPINDLY family)
MNLAVIDQLLAKGALAEARNALDTLLALTPRDRDALMRLVDVHTAMQAHSQALARAHELFALDAENLDAMFYLAKAQFACGNLGEAKTLIDRLSRTPAKDAAAFQFLRGNVCVAEEQFAGAEHAFQTATTQDNNFAVAFANLGFVRQRLGNMSGAREAFKRATTLMPQAKESWTALAHLHHAEGAVVDAEACFQRALKLDGNVSATWAALGNLYAETFNFVRARECFERVLAIDPVNEQVRSLLGFVLAEVGETQGALSVLKADGQRAPSLSRRIREALLLPQVYESADDLQRWRERYAAGLDALSSLNVDPAEVWTISQPNFLLAYQGRNDRDLQRRYSAVLRKMILAARPDLLEPLKHQTNRQRIKVVFVSSFFRECTIGHYFRSWISDLDATLFERVVVHTGWQLDAFAAALEKQCDQFVIARDGVVKIAEMIRAMNADIIIYLEVGMGAQNYLLTNMRLAPIQIAAWGHPVTTGSSEIDYFITCGEMESENAEEHYTERLLRLPGIGTSYALPTSVAPHITRESLGLAREQTLYLCPQSLFKIHPDNDGIYLEIISRDPHAVLLFFQAMHPAITNAFSQRLSRQMKLRGITPRGQIKFLPRVDESRFRALLSLADVILDTLHWSGGNTSLDALAVATPIVTLPGEFMRGRQTQAMLRAMGANEMVATNRGGYVAQAMAVASDRDLRIRLHGAIAANRGEVFGRVEPVKQLAQNLQMVFETSRFE